MPYAAFQNFKFEFNYLFLLLGSRVSSGQQVRVAGFCLTCTGGSLSTSACLGRKRAFLNVRKREAIDRFGSELDDLLNEYEY